MPSSQPYLNSPHNYFGKETITVSDNIPQNGINDFFDHNSTIVDWILVELHDQTTQKIYRRAGFTDSDGSLLDVDGSTGLRFSKGIFINGI